MGPLGGRGGSIYCAVYSPARQGPSESLGRPQHGIGCHACNSLVAKFVKGGIFRLAAADEGQAGGGPE